MRVVFGWLRAFVDISIMLGLIVGSSLSAMGLLAFIWPSFDILNQFQLLFLALTVISAIATFLWPYYFPRLKPYAQALLLVPFLCSIGVLAPDILGSLRAPKMDINQFQKGPKRVLKAMSFNIYLNNWDKARTVAAIERYDPDIVFLQEYAPNRYKNVPALKKRYPYRARCQHWSHCTLAILSKYPLSNIGHAKLASVHARDQVHGRVLSASLRIKGFKPLRLHSFHADWPKPLGEQDLHFDRLRTYITKDMKRYPNAVLAGDFNSSSWSFTLRNFSAALPMDRHTYLMPTYPASEFRRRHYLWPPAFLSLDHIFSSSTVPVVNVRRGSAPVADHHPLLADIILAPH
ncbi:MAG: endonuclease/exonuclease/phosphatase family protein [Cohaesibacter sp.]|nr:endonuclease/exonuclease/phosphatase family protein [Cohaesibacter sp.]